MKKIKTSGFDDLVPANAGKRVRLVGVIAGKKKRDMTATTIAFKCTDCGQETTRKEEIWEAGTNAEVTCENCGSTSMRALTGGADLHPYQVANILELPEHASALHQREVDVILTRDQTTCKVGERILSLAHPEIGSQDDHLLVFRRR